MLNIDRLKKPLVAWVPWVRGTKVQIRFLPSDSTVYQDSQMLDLPDGRTALLPGETPKYRLDKDQFRINLGRAAVVGLTGFTRQDDSGQEIPVEYSPELVDDLMTCDPFYDLVNLHCVNLDKLLAAEESAATKN